MTLETQFLRRSPHQMFVWRAMGLMTCEAIPDCHGSVHARELSGFLGMAPCAKFHSRLRQGLGGANAVAGATRFLIGCGLVLVPDH